MKAKAIELVLFRTKPGISVEALIEAAAKVNTFVQAQPGFVQRNLAVNEEGQWTDIVYWTDMAAAHQAAEAALSSPICQPFFGMIDEATMKMHHFDIVF